MLYKVKDIERLLADDYLHFVMFAHHSFARVKRGNDEDVATDAFEYNLNDSIEHLEGLIKASPKKAPCRQRCELYIAALKQLRALRLSARAIGF